jgi:hypothetical protein
MKITVGKRPVGMKMAYENVSQDENISKKKASQ